ncbi:MAG: tRNA (adenosine(37)-N6)-dimethylallyltransferase MiaA [Treponema sp.]|jgi:tRNA dimethylallyltransferase|nr:tRNA (adenosine(37)-N6)-dimethylallyltransferase MiaA [Treponema sp.]
MDRRSGSFEPIPVYILFGPTASGKTAVLARLFTEGMGDVPVCPAEVVSADSMQVYRGLDIGTAKPGPEERRRLPHHLVDIRNPDEQFTAGDFVRLADAACVDIARRGKLPVVSGGTGFYLKNFILRLPEAPPSDPEIRAELKTEFRRRGAAALMEELRAADPVSAGRIHLNDEYRLLRALEVFRLSGRPLSSYAFSGGGTVNGTADNGSGGARSGLSRPSYRFLIIGLKRPREELYRRINERCTAMFRAGLPEEAAGLWKKGYTPKDPGLRAIGYREFFVEDEGGAYRLSGDFAAVEALAAQNSRRYAKRQMTYFASLPDVRWMAPEDTPGMRKEISSFLKA